MAFGKNESICEISQCLTVGRKGQLNDLRTGCVHLLLRIFRRAALRENLRFHLTKGLNHAGAACLSRPKHQPDERGDAREDEHRTDPRIPERSEANTTEHARDGEAGNQRPVRPRGLCPFKLILHLTVLGLEPGIDSRDGRFDNPRQLPS